MVETQMMCSAACATHDKTENTLLFERAHTRNLNSRQTQEPLERNATYARAYHRTYWTEGEGKCRCRYLCETRRGTLTQRHASSLHG